MSVYRLYCDAIVSEYATVTHGLEEIARACARSEFQFLNHQTIQVSFDGGIIFPDMMEPCGVPLISARFRRLLLQQGVELFEKEVDLVDTELGYHEPYFLLLPPRLDCLDADNSKYAQDWATFAEIVPMRPVEKVKIREAQIGYAQIFRVAGVLDATTYVTEELAQQILAAKLRGVICENTEGGF